MKLKVIFQYLWRVSIFKTIYFNFKYFDAKTAVKFPVFINKGVKLLSLNGSVIINKANVTTGLIVFTKTCSLDFNGKVIFEGKARFGTGTHIYVGENGIICFGDEFWLTKNVEINCNKEITFGYNCLLAWNINILDTDFHRITRDNNIINTDASIIIGNNVWIGCEVIILKGTKIGSDIVIGAGSLLNKEYIENGCIYAGNPAKIVATDISWKY